MLCDFCHKNVATVHLTEIIDGKIQESHLCQKCAHQKTEELKDQLSLSDLLSGLVSPEGEEKRKEALLKCSFCGLTTPELRKIGRIGCSKCYLTFKKYLGPLLKKIHGSTQHIGKVPRKVKLKIARDRRAKELSRQLQRAIKLEEYEEAARLRDEIKKIEKKEDV